MAKKLFVGGLSWDTTEDSLRNFFSQAGTVETATVITNKYTGKSKGFGFVEMASEEEAQQAINTLNGQELDGRTITVNEAQPFVPRENRPGGNFSRPSYGGGRDNRGSRNGGGNRGSGPRQSYNDND